MTGFRFDISGYIPFQHQAILQCVESGKLSVAHAVSDTDDEFVELNEDGATRPARKKARPAAGKKTASKVTVKKKATATQAEATESAAEAEPAGDTDKAPADEAGAE